MLLAANGERLIKVVSVLGEPLARVRVSAGVGGSAEERFTNEQGDVLLTIADTAPLRFDTPDGRCMPYVTMAGSRKEFPVRLFEHGSASFVEQVTDGVVRRSIRPEWRLVYSSDIADERRGGGRKAIEALHRVVDYLDSVVLRGLCRVTIGTTVPQGVSILSVTVDRTINPEQYGAIASREMSGNIVVNAAIRYALPEYAESEVLGLHECGHALQDHRHVTVQPSIMNIGVMYDYKNDFTADEPLNMTLRAGQLRQPGTGLRNGTENDLGVPSISIAAVGAGQWEDLPPCPPPLRA